MNAPAQGRAIKDVEDLPFKSASPSPILNPSGFARTMEINAHVISGLDPGAIPGGSTNPPSGFDEGARGRSASTDV